MSQLLGVECPSCKTTLEIEGDEMIGQTVECPECQAKIVVPPDAARLKRTLKLKDVEPEEVVATRQCPECMKTLKADAAQCPDCGHVFDSDEDDASSSDGAGVSGFLKRYKWAVIGGVAAVILVVCWVVSSVHAKRIDREYAYAMDSATTTKSLDQSISILQAITQRYPDHTAFQQARRLLLDKQSERSAMMAVTEAVKTAREQREAGQYDAAISNLQDAVSAYSHTPNVQEAKTLLGRLRAQQREYQTDQVKAALVQVRSMSKSEAAVVLAGIVEANPFATNLSEATNLLAKVQAAAVEEQALAEVRQQFPPGSFLLQSKKTVYGPYIFTNAYVVKLGSAALAITNVQGTTFSMKHLNLGRMYGPFEFVDGGSLLLGKISYTIVVSNLLALMPPPTSTNALPPAAQGDKSGKSGPSTNAAAGSQRPAEASRQPSSGPAAASLCTMCNGTGKIPCPDPGCVAVRETNRDAGEEVAVLRRKTSSDGGVPGVKRLTPCNQCGRTGQVTCPQCKGSGRG